MSALPKWTRRSAVLAAAVVAGVACGHSAGGDHSGPAGWIAVDYTLGQPFSLADAAFYESFSGDASGQPPFEYRPEIPFGSCSSYPAIGHPAIRWRDVGASVHLSGQAGTGDLSRATIGDRIVYSGDPLPPSPDVMTVSDVTFPEQPSWLEQLTMPSMPQVAGWTASDGELSIDALMPLALATTSLGADEFMIDLSSSAGAEFCRFDTKTPIVLTSSALEAAPASGTIEVYALHLTQGTLDSRPLLLLGVQSRQRDYTR